MYINLEVIEKFLKVFRITTHISIKSKREPFLDMERDI